jgi:hypothetical protein
MMKKPSLQRVVKSTFVLMNGGKIFKWWQLWQNKWGGTHEHGDSRANGGSQEKVFK